MNKKQLLSMKLLILVCSLVLTTSFSFSKGGGGIKSGGDTGRDPVLGINFMGGHYSFGAELELDLKLGDGMSIAPRLGFTGFNWFAPGISLRFGILDGVRPHGFWVGPSLDLIIGSNKTKWNGTTFEDETFFAIAPAVEFGWRYTFDFGLSLQPLTRLGAYFGDGSGFFWSLGLGIGYAF